MEQSELLKLFVKYCPIWYYTKHEPYMPATFEDILSISSLTADPKAENFESLKAKLETDPLAAQLDPIKLNSILDIYSKQDVDKMMIKISNELRQKVPVGKQIICRTTGLWSRTLPAVDINWQYLDLQYITMYTWNGTLGSHAFDIEHVVVRLVKTDKASNWVIKRVYGSSHGNGMWTDTQYLEMEGEHPVIYCANESHSMYFKPAVYKRMFRFGDDVCSRDTRWEPSVFIYVPIDTIPVVRAEVSNGIINLISNLNHEGVELTYYRYHGKIGNEKKNQVFPLSTKYIDTDTNNLDSYYKYEGGVNNIFNGRHAKVSRSTYITILVVISCILSINAVSLFMGPLKINSKLLLALKWILNILSVPALGIAIIAFLFIN